MKYAEYEKQVLSVLKELRDAAILEETAVLSLRGLESVYDRGAAQESIAALSAGNSCCKTEEDDPIDFECLVKEYVDLPPDDFEQHFKAVLRGEEPSMTKIAEGEFTAVVTIDDATLGETRKLVRQYEHHQIEGIVFVNLRTQAQLASAAATACIPGTSRISREDFLVYAGQAYDDTELAHKLLVEMMVDEREAALNPPPPVPPIVDVG